VTGEVQGEADVRAVERQVARILSLDHDGEAGRLARTCWSPGSPKE
jgi:hypothetical protein